MKELNWICLQFQQLQLDQLYAILKLRAEVFIVEQNCVYQDLDSHDKNALHLMGFRDEELIAYARLLPPGVTYDGCSIGRVVTSKSVRRDGCGRQLMETAISNCQQNWPAAAITISAQHYLESFYRSLGFVTESEPYQEDGIPHIKMSKVHTP